MIWMNIGTLLERNDALEAERDALREGFDAVTEAAIRDGCCCEGRDESEGLDPCARCVATVARAALTPTPEDT